MVPPMQIRELTSTCAALCASRSLRDVLQYIVPVTQSCISLAETRRPESKVKCFFLHVLSAVNCW